ncbi:restriction endonuclease subunit S [Clostridium sp. cel8]|uniref:restriction endonuclease subunit S n=1 Tax=Clostridium sp. cel8 TaxID=2663123 RepID=UPI001A9AE979|nr:restriction endonuclease subunit S [Clostridium sp. cel8]
MDSKFFKIGDIFNVEKGLVQSSKNVDGQFDFITASAEWKTHNEYSHDCEALVFAAGAAGSLGRTHYVNGKFIASDLCFVLTPKDNLIDKVDLKFYFYYFKLNRDTIVKSIATGTSKLAINMKNFKNYCIPLPSIEYQKLGRERIEEVEPKINELNLIFKKNLTYITKLRQSILQEAVQGKLVPQDPDDEPASVLLERIKEEKERLIKEKKIKKQKPLPPITEDEIPYELPKGWEWVRLGEICSLITDGTHSTPNYVSKGVPFLSVKDISNGFIDFNHTRFITQQEHEELIKRCKPEYGDVLLTKVGTTGIAKVIDTKREFSIFVSLALLKIIHNTLYPYYIEYMLNSPLGKKQSEENTQGIGNKNLVIKCIKNFIVPLPPLNEQKRIVEKANQLMTLCDELEKNIEQSKKDSELLMQSVLQEAFKEA